MAIKTVGADLLRVKLQSASRASRLPVRAMFELTYRCNFSCLHCYNSDGQKAAKPKDELTTEEIFRIIDEIRSLNCFVLGFTGGEVFVRRDAMDIFRYAKKSGFEVLIYTNGYYIDEKIADELKELSPNKVDISLHGFSKNTFEAVTQAPGSRERVYRAIGLLSERKVPLGMKSNFFEINKEEIPSIKKYADSIGALYRFSPDFFGRNDGSKGPYQYQLEPDEIERMEEILYPRIPSLAGHPADGMMSENEAARKTDAPKPIFSCGVGYTDLVINPFGEVKPCIEFDRPTFKIKGSSVRECWQMVMNYVDKINLTDDYECKHCDIKQYCTHCPASGYLATGNFTECNPYARKKAEYRKKKHEEGLLTAAQSL